MKRTIQERLKLLIDYAYNEDCSSAPEHWEVGVMCYKLDEAIVRITNLEAANKGAYKALLECEALVKKLKEELS